MSVVAITSSKLLAHKPHQHRATWRNNKATAFQTNILHAVRCLLENNKGARREQIYETLKTRWGLVVEVKRFYKGGGVGNFCWLPRKGCLRVQVGASRIDSRKFCFRYAPCVEIYDNWE